MRTHYNQYLQKYSKEHRTSGTKAEAILWKKVLRAKQLNGFQFNRQFIIGNYIVDFVCRSLKLIIEIDGQSHTLKGENDIKRQQYLEDLGY